jgi:uncharacterized delta-60 repeat protein
MFLNKQQLGSPFYLTQKVHRQKSITRLVFIDPGVADYQSLVAGVLPQTTVVVLRPDQDGIEQISQVLASYQEVNSLHIISHGAPGRIYLGNSQVSQETLNYYAGQLIGWAEALDADAQLLLYGCAVAQGQQGKAFIHQLSELTGAVVAASAQLTGNAKLGGNWELEIRTGATSPDLALHPEVMANYASVLVTAELDTTFGNNGVAVNNVGGSDILTSITLLPNGQILAAGYSTHSTNDANYPTQFILTLYNANGTVDTGFGDNGTVTTQFSSSNSSSVAYSVTVDSSGNIYVAGYTSSNITGGQDVFAIASYTSTGAPNTAFGTNGNGLVTTPASTFGLTGNVFIKQILIQSDGNILAVGDISGSDNIILASYTPSGSLDTTFNSSGSTPGIVVTNPFGNGVGGISGAVIIPASSTEYPGEILLAGTLTPFGSTQGEVALALYKANGTLDTIFGINGVCIPFIGSNDTINGVAIDGNDILVAGSVNGQFALMAFSLSSGVHDTTFGTGGVAYLPASVTAGTSDYAQSVVVQSNGTILVSGQVNGQLVVAEYNSDGTINTSFGNGGVFTVPGVTLNSANTTDGSLAVQGNGEIIVGGSGQDSNNGSDLSLAEIQPNLVTAKLVTTFGNNDNGTGTSGVAANNVGGSDILTSITLDNGQILAAGYSTPNTNDANYPTQFILTLYNPDGTVDTSFGNQGTLTTQFSPSNSSSVAYSVTVDSSGNIYVAGYTSSDLTNGQDVFAIASYTCTGAPNTAFGTNGNGLVTTPASSFGLSGNISIKQILIQSDGNILAVGDSSNSAAIILASYTPSGSLDQTFGSSGIAVVPNVFNNANGGVGGISGAVIIPASSTEYPGEILLAGTFTPYASTQGEVALALYQANGSPNTSFGTNGIVLTQVGGVGSNDTTNGVAIDGNDILVAGSVNGQFALMAFSLSTGSLDTTFGTNGVAYLPTAGTSGYAQSVVVQSNGTILVSGQVNNQLVVAEYNSSTGAIDTSFNNSGVFTVPGVTLSSANSTDGSLAVQNNGEIIVGGSGQDQNPNNGSDFSLAEIEANPGPSNVFLQGNTINEYAADGTNVGTFATQNPFFSSGYTYSFVSGNNDNADFQIVNNNQLQFEGTPPTTLTSYTIDAQVTDPQGLTAQDALTITVNPVTPVLTGGSVNNLLVEENSGPTPLFTSQLAFGGGSPLESNPNLVYTVTGLPDPSLGTVFLANGTTAVADNTTYSLTQLQGFEFQPTTNADSNTATGSNSLTFTVNDPGANDVLTESVGFTVSPVNEPPISTGSSVSNLTVLENSGLNSLGLSGVDYAPGGGTDEQSQSLLYKVTSLPDSSLGTVFQSNGTTPVNVNTQYSLSQLQGFEFEPTTNADNNTYTGSNTFTYVVTTGNPYASLPQSLNISVTPVNQAPLLTGGNLNNLTVLAGSGFTSLGLSGLNYAVGGGKDQQESETLNYTITGVPSSNLGKLYLADGVTPVTVNSTYTLAQLQGVEFDATNNNKVSGTGTFSFAVQEVPSGNTGQYTLNQSLNITVNDVVNSQQESWTNEGNGVFQASNSGGSQGLLLATVTGFNSSSVDQIGVFVADNSSGDIGDLAPGDPGYTLAALERGQELLSALANSPNGFSNTQISSYLEFNSVSNLGFYIVQNSTAANVLAGNTPTSNVQILSSSQVQSTGKNSYNLNWSDGTNGTTQNLQVNIQPTTGPIPLGAGLQVSKGLDVIDLTGVSGPVTASFTLNRSASYNNFGGIYITDQSGDVLNSSGGIVAYNPDTGKSTFAQYDQAAVSNMVQGMNMVVGNNQVVTINSTLTGGEIYAPFLIQNDTNTADVNGSSSAPSVWFPFIGANSDNFDHVRLLGDNVFGFEDLTAGGDKDFNDLIMHVNLTANT